MRKGRILSVIMLICVQLAVCIADQERMDAFQADRRTEDSPAESDKSRQDVGQAEKDAERGQSIEQAEEGAESGQGMEQAEEDAGSETEAEADSGKMSDISYMQTYRLFLEAYREENENASGTRIMFALIDDDYIPELLLFEDDCHAAVVKVYTCDQDSVIELGGFGSFGRMQYVERGGMILSAYTGQGVYNSAFFQMKGREAKQICTLTTYAPPDGSPEIFEIDDTGVTEETYQKKWRELHDTYEYVLVKYEDAFSLSELETEELLAKAKDALQIHRDSLQLKMMVEAQSEALEGYAAFLTKYAAEQKEADGGEAPAFALIYLDGDNVPELVLMDGDAHLCGAFVYRYEEDRTVPVGAYGQYGALFYREKEGIVLDSYDSFGDIYDYIYRIEGSQKTLLQSLSEKNVISAKDGKVLDTIYTVDGKETSLEQYQQVYEKWIATDHQKVEYHMCRKLTADNIQKDLQEELENLILAQEDVLKQNVLIAAGAQKENLLLFDYDDYDGDGKYEAFMIVGRTFDNYGDLGYHSALYFAGADGSISELDDSFGIYRKIDGKMEFSPGRKYLFFYTDYVFTANATELWTVRNGKPVDESELFGHYQVVYRGENERNEFEVWVDAYDQFCEKGGFRSGEDMWWGHTYKPYFWYYDSDTDQIRKYGGRIITKGDFEELGGTDVIEGIKEEGYTIGEIIRWDNDIVTVNYHYEHLGEDGNPSGCEVYDNVIWDNAVKDYWRKDERFVISWRTAGVGGSYYL